MRRSSGSAAYPEAIGKRAGGRQVQGVRARKGYCAGFSPPPPRDVALAREDWLTSDGGFEGGMKGFFKSMFGGGVSGIRDALRDDQSALAARGAAMEAEIAANEVVTQSEAGWLVDRIGRDGVLHENEKALLRFIREESPDTHPALRPRMDKLH